MLKIIFAFICADCIVTTGWIIEKLVTDFYKKYKEIYNKALELLPNELYKRNIDAMDFCIHHKIITSIILHTVMLTHLIVVKEEEEVL